jgi:UPF0271 protein
MNQSSKTIDLNADVGEKPTTLSDGTEESLIRLITSANIACGGHAGDDESMQSVVGLCRDHGVAVGAHPGFPDKAGFGRVFLNMPPSELEASIRSQVLALHRVASNMGVPLQHVKPHGALYNASVTNASIAASIAHAVASINQNLILVGLAGSRMLEVWAAEGFAVIGEAFADRRYEADGSLRSRRFPDALITDANEAARQALQIATGGAIRAINGTALHVQARTICVHGDTKNAAAIGKAVRHALEGGGVVVRSISSSLH